MWRLVWMHVYEHGSSLFEKSMMLTFARECLVLSRCRFLVQHYPLCRHTCARAFEPPVQSTQDMLLVGML